MSEAFDRLLEIMKRLRGNNGCPWDREQTMDTLKPFLIEETYEVLESIDDTDRGKMKLELGDLLFQIIFFSEIAEEKGEFNIDDVLNSSIEKMIRRHPHVFGNSLLKNSKEVLSHWEEIKKREKGGNKESVMDGIPEDMPSVLKAFQVQARAARVGFDWNNIDDVFGKVKEEMGEFEEAIKETDQRRIEEELGDLFFSLVNTARFLKLNPEDVILKAVKRFTDRFKFIEKKVEITGRRFQEMTIDDLNELWEEAKKELTR
ncbi:MAG: nucleoside triphosphate pyrophosphohydrolase [Nitrospirota bacterium]